MEGKQPSILIGESDTCVLVSIQAPHFPQEVSGFAVRKSLDLTRLIARWTRRVILQHPNEAFSEIVLPLEFLHALMLHFPFS